MKREIGKWFMDVSKYVATAVVISTFVGTFKEIWLLYTVGIVITIVTFSLGLFFLTVKK
jgi:hypothetical protein